MLGLSQSGVFHPKCPYYEAKTPVGGYPPICRGREEFEDGTVFVGDSFGDHVWIDATEPRDCPLTCLCYELDCERMDEAAEKKVFAFTFTKNSSTLQIQIHSEDLRREVLEAVRPATPTMKEAIVNKAGSVNGLALLKYRHTLLDRLTKLEQSKKSRLLVYQKRTVSGDDSRSVSAELSLLVRGILGDDEMLKRFGLAELHRQRWLQAGQGPSFQTSQVAQQIDLIERVNHWFDYGSFHESEPTLLTSEGGWSEEHGIRDFDEIWDDFEQILPDYTWKPEQYAITTEYPTFEKLRGMGEYPLVPKRRALVSEFGSPEVFLLQAVRDGDILGVRALLQRATAGSQDSSRISGDVLDLNTILEETTVLMEAVRRGHQRIAKMLIQHGANVNILGMASSESALSIAAKTGSAATMRLLLGSGAELESAITMLQLDQSEDSGPRAINRLATFAACYRNQILRDLRGVRGEVLRLRREFHNEHDRMKRMATLLTNRHRESAREGLDPQYPVDLSETWAYGLEHRARRPWSIALRTLRGLCNGILPRDLNETLMFVALSRAMSSIVYTHDLERATAEFNQDLGRWQLLFNADGGLRAFQAAVKAIWGVDALTMKPTPHADEDLLAAFQDMALTFVARASKVYKTETMDNLGLLSTQNRWRQRRQKDFAAVDTTGSSNSCLLGMEGQSGDDEASSQGAPAERPEFDIILDPPKPPPPLNREPTPSDRLLVFLMAGAIFAAIIAFLLLLRQDLIPHVVYSGASATKTVVRVAHPTHRRETTLGDVLAPRYSQFRLLGMRERSYYLLVTYLEFPLSRTVPRTNRKHRMAPVEPLAPSGMSVSNSASLSPEPAKIGRSRKPKRTFCKDCQKGFSTTSNYGKHRAGPKHNKIRYACSFPSCGKSYLRNDERAKHERKAHGGHSC